MIGARTVASSISIYQGRQAHTFVMTSTTAPSGFHTLFKELNGVRGCHLVTVFAMRFLGMVRHY
jgi:hypothetical protein